MDHYYAWLQYAMQSQQQAYNTYHQPVGGKAGEGASGMEGGDDGGAALVGAVAGIPVDGAYSHEHAQHAQHVQQVLEAHGMDAAQAEHMQQAMAMQQHMAMQQQHHHHQQHHGMLGQEQMGYVAGALDHSV
jgi:hypothetical protein